MSWYSWQLQLSKSCRPLPLARTYAARPGSPFWRLRIALATKRRALARSAPSCDLRYSGEVFGRLRPALQHLFARFATIISGCGNWGRRCAIKTEVPGGDKPANNGDNRWKLRHVEL